MLNLNDPMTQILLGTSLGGAIGATYAGFDAKDWALTPDEKARKKLVTTIRGAILGAGTGLLPSLFGVTL